MQIKGSAELHDEVLKKDLCVNCGGCLGHCPYFKSHRGKVARMSPCAISQGRCHAHCPKVEVVLESLAMATHGRPYDGTPLGHHLGMFKARAAGAIREKGRYQNGGVVTALVCFALESGLINAAALTGRSGLVPVPVLARSEAEVLACAQAKYMTAPTLATVNEYSKAGEDKLGVVGTPCQITSVAQMKLDPLRREGFRDAVALSIGLLCTWGVDTRKFNGLVSGQIDPDQVLSMDVPPPPASVMQITGTEKTITIPLEEIRKTVPPGCAICPDMSAEFADVSVGALEGDYQWNTLIIRTQKGRKLVEDAAAAGYLELDKMPETQRENLFKGAAGKKKRALLKARQEGLLNRDPAAGGSALVIDDRIVDKILACP